MAGVDGGAGDRVVEGREVRVYRMLPVCLFVDCHQD